jgi:hypothetical protein
MLAKKGCDTVKLESTTGEGTSFTALGDISCAGEKLLLWVLAKGRKVHCERKFGPDPKAILPHSKSGWATENVIIESIKWLHQEIADYKPCALVLNVYPTHSGEWVIASAEEDNMELLFVPAGGIGRFQPMDRRAFGELRARAPAEFSRQLRREGSETMNHSTSVDIPENCWASVPEDDVQRAWNVV